MTESRPWAVHASFAAKPCMSFSPATIRTAASARRMPLLAVSGPKWHPMGGASHRRSRRAMKYRIGKLGEELRIEIVGKDLPFDWSCP